MAQTPRLAAPMRRTRAADPLTVVIPSLLPLSPFPSLMSPFPLMSLPPLTLTLTRDVAALARLQALHAELCAIVQRFGDAWAQCDTTAGRRNYTELAMLSGTAHAMTHFLNDAAMTSRRKLACFVEMARRSLTSQQVRVALHTRRTTTTTPHSDTDGVDRRAVMRAVAIAELYERLWNKQASEK